MAEATFSDFLSGLEAASTRFTDAPAVPGGGSRTPAGELAYELRTRLAVRGWIDPKSLLYEAIDPELFSDALRAVAPDVETSYAINPDAWYLAAPARRRILAERDPAVIHDELATERCTEDRTDPIRLALRQQFGLDPSRPAAAMPKTLAEALLQVQDWSPTSTPSPEIQAEVAGRVRTEDLARLTAQPLVGEVHRRTLQRLVQICSDTGGARQSAVYIHALGGGGKSTVLAYLEHDLLMLPEPPPVVRIDLDDPLIDPTDPVSLDIALLDRLAVNRPDMVVDLAERLDRSRRSRRGRDTWRKRSGPQKDSRTDALRAKFERLKDRAVGWTRQVMDSAGLESIESLEESERDSSLRDALGGWSDVPSVVIVDTAETTACYGLHGLIELANWLGGLVPMMGLAGVRVVIAGRDPPSADPSRDVAAALRQAGFAVEPPIALPELGTTEAATLLENAGVAEPAVAASAAAALPGNPLLLRMAADVLRGSEDIAQAAREHHARGAIDRVTAQRYLGRRILAHLADPAARAYLLVALRLPIVTARLIAEVVIPLTDGPLLPEGPENAVIVISSAEPAKPAKAGPSRQTVADKVFRSLLVTRWLAWPEEGGTAFRFQPDVRGLVRVLLDADPAERARSIEIHEAAAAFHRARRPSNDRALALYHEALAGSALDDGELALLRNSYPELAAELSGDPAAPPVPSDTRPMSEREWRRHLEGSGGKNGQGAMLLQRGFANEALTLYRGRPTRPRGVPPAFVIQALADTGDWATDEVDTDGILDEIERRYPDGRIGADELTRVYWLTRLELLRRDTLLAPRHAAVLRRIAPRLRGADLASLPGLMALVEAASGVAMPLRWTGGASVSEATTRVALVRGLAGGEIGFEPRLDELVVTQRDWSARLARTAGALIDVERLNRPGEGWPAHGGVQAQIDALHGAPFDQVNVTLRALDRRESVHTRGDRQASALLLRGLTGEFLRPLRHVLADAYAGPNRAAVDLAVQPVLAAMTIRPREFEPDVLADRLADNPRAWFAALVGFADRSRLLPLLCDGLLRQCDNTPLLRVARSFQSWDQYLSGGTSPPWWALEGS